MESKFTLTYADTLLRAGIFLDAEANTILLHEALPLSFTQFRILHAIHEGIVQPATIAHMLAVSHPAMSRHIKNLVTAKLVSVTESVESRRENHVTLTKKGTAVHKHAEVALQKNLKKSLSSLAPSARTTTLATLEKTILACAHS